MVLQAAVVGASGYAGTELLRVLARHPDFEVVIATAQRAAGERLASLAPSLAWAYPDLRFVSSDTSLAGIDMVFLALPHGESQRIVPGLDNPYIVDLAADFRLPAEEYRAWYGADHGAPTLLDTFVCGLPELFREELRGATRIAAPGCYPTAAVLALAPLVAGDVIDPVAITVNALSGVSGRGRALSEGSLFSEVNESAHAYGIATHRHTPEIEQMLESRSPTPVLAQFTPHLVPMTRGIVATCTAPLRDPATTTADLERIADAFYEDAAFVSRSADPAPTKAVTSTNGARVTYRADDRTGNAIAIAVIDNLVKGTAGQAVQATNVMLGLPEDTGLDVLGCWP